MATIPHGFHSLPLAIAQLSLAAVLKCGQSFRWSVYPLEGTGPSHEYRFCLQDRLVCLRQSPEVLYYRTVYPEPQPDESQRVICDSETLVWLKDYFQLDVDLIKLYEHWAKRDSIFAAIRGRFDGIRMLRQDPWENLISFICSSNNNISRISKMIQNLCTQYSPPLLSLKHPSTDEILSYHPFPFASVLAKPEVSAELRKLGFGYRADFIQKTAAMLTKEHLESDDAVNKWLFSLRDMPTAEAREHLLRYMGVGRKVADCVLLMSLDKKEVIPVDTHVHQIAVRHYGFKGTAGKATMNLKLYDAVNTKLTGIWGDYAGWTQTVMFTSDLKAFASYGLAPEKTLPTPSPTPTPASSPSKRALETDTEPSSKRRRRRGDI